MDFPQRISCTPINFSKVKKLLWRKNSTFTEQLNNKMFKNPWMMLKYFSSFSKTGKFKGFFLKDRCNESLFVLVKNSKRAEILSSGLSLCLKYKQKAKQILFCLSPTSRHLLPHFTMVGFCSRDHCATKAPEVITRSVNH